jgi:hypothetical protein
MYKTRSYTLFIIFAGLLLLPGVSAVSLLKQADGFDPHEANPRTKFRLEGIEVTQSIQSKDNTVPLIQDKPTIVRIYLLAGESAGYYPYINRVTGVLDGRQVSTGASLSPARLPSINIISDPSVSSLTYDRKEIERSINFLLPRSWTEAGPIQLTFTPTVDGKDYPCIGGCSDSSRNYDFVKSKAVTLQFLDTPYQIGAAGLVRHPRQLDFNMADSWITRAYPSPGVYEDSKSRMSISPTLDHLPTCDEVNKKIAYLYLLDSYDSGTFSNTRYYGLVSDIDGFMRGCSPVPSNSGSGPAGSNTFGWDFDGSYDDWYSGHEIGHEYGRSHPYFADDSACRRDDSLIIGVDASYPYSNGFISNPDLNYFGFDMGDPGKLKVPRQVYSGDVWTDVMTYRCNEWISNYTYEAILDTLRTESETPVYPYFGSSPGAFINNTLRTNESLIVVGTLDLSAHTVNMGPFLRLPTNGPYTGLSPNYPYSIDLVDNQGQTLARYPFQPQVYSDTPREEHQLALVSAIVPFVPGTKKIAISENGQQIFSRIVGASTLKVTLISPRDGDIFEPNNNISVKWRSQDGNRPNLQNLSYFLLYRPNGESGWHTVGVDLKGPQVILNSSELPGGDKAQFRLIASDGVNTAFADTTGSFRIPTKSPEPMISYPPNNSTYFLGRTVLLSGKAFDREDGSLQNDSSLIWSSDKQGKLGNGSWLTVSNLTLGIHKITLTAKDSDGSEKNSTNFIRVVDPLKTSGITIATNPNMLDRIGSKNITNPNFTPP